MNDKIILSFDNFEDLEVYLEMKFEENDTLCMDDERDRGKLAYSLARALQKKSNFEQEKYKKNK